MRWWALVAAAGVVIRGCKETELLIGFRYVAVLKLDIIIGTA